MKIADLTRIHTDTITEAVQILSEVANYALPEDVYKALETIHKTDKSSIARNITKDILYNAYLASTKQRPICQDTGLVIVFADIGQNVHIIGDDFTTAINKGVEKAYTQAYLRKSIVEDPIFQRTNTGNNTPAVIHQRIVPGNEIKLTVVPKGGGCENMSYFKMLKPSDGVEGIINFVVDCIKKSGPNPCPPIHVGIGIGGSMEQSAILAKRALINKVLSIEDLKHKAETDELAALELKILQEVQNTGIGPHGLGGSHTAFALNIETYPCHIASLPVSVTLNCHAARHTTLTIGKNSNHIETLYKNIFSIPEITPKAEHANTIKCLTLPLSRDTIKSLSSGEQVLLNGYLYTARDTAHKKLVQAIEAGEPLPFSLEGETIYYVGPCPAKGEEIIGPAGPTTAIRMDKYTPILLKAGLAGMIGKGYRSKEIVKAIKETKSVYLVASGGTAVLLAEKIKEAKVIAYPELGPEAIYRLKVEDFPAIVCVDSHGNDCYDYMHA